jgi:hypothetical protein
MSALLLTPLGFLIAAAQSQRRSDHEHAIGETAVALQRQMSLVMSAIDRIDLALSESTLSSP